MDNSTKTIGITGATIWGNRGAEAMLCTTIGILSESYPNAKFNVFSYYPLEDEILCNKEGVNFYDFSPLKLALKITPCSLMGITKEVKAIKNCDLVVDLAGISYCDGREKFLLYNIFSLLPFLISGIPVIKLSQALGSFKGSINRFFSKVFLPCYKKIFARGEATLKNLEDLNSTKVNYELSSDIAFLYKPEFSLSEEGLQETSDFIKLVSSQNQGKKIATIIPSSLLFSKDENYKDKIIYIINKLLSKNYFVVLAPNATKKETGKPRNNDLFAISRIYADLQDKSNVLAVDFDVNTSGIKKILQESNIVLTSRFHGMIGALSLHKPTLVIGWSHKYAEVLEQLGIKDSHLDYKVSKEEIDKVVDKFILKQEQILELLNKNIPQVNELTRKQFDYVLELLG